MTDLAFCPHCGARRPAWAKFCGSCGNAYDVAPAGQASGGPGGAASTAADSNPAGPETSAAGSGAAPIGTWVGSGLLPAIIVVIGLFGVLVASVLLSGGTVGSADGSGSISADIPPVGQIWFGTDFDPTTFAMGGRSDTAPTGRTVAMVAHLASALGSGEANVRIELDGTIMADNRLQLSGTPAGDVVGFTLAFPVAGSYRVTITDVSGAALATGVVAAQ